MASRASDGSAPQQALAAAALQQPSDTPTPCHAVWCSCPAVQHGGDAGRGLGRGLGMMGCALGARSTPGAATWFFPSSTLGQALHGAAAQAWVFSLLLPSCFASPKPPWQ